MLTSTLVIQLTGIIAMLVALVSFLCWRIARNNDELCHKNNVIVREVEHNQRLIDRAVSLGLNRAALLLTFAAILTCGLSFTSCVDNSVDNPVVPEPEVVVPDHFINEAWMDRTVNPGDNFYKYALGTWLTSHADDDQGIIANTNAKNSALINKSLYTSDNPLAQHLVRNMKTPKPTLAEDVKAILDHLDIQKPTGIGMLLTEIGRLQDKGLNPIFTKKECLHAQTHTYVEMVTVGMIANAAQALLEQDGNEEQLKAYIWDILTAIDEVSDPERIKAEGYEAELEERVSAIYDEEALIYKAAKAADAADNSSDPDQPYMKGMRSMPAYIEAGSIARGRATRAGGSVKDEISLETLSEAFHLLSSGSIVDTSTPFKDYVEQGAGVTTVLKTMDRCYDYLRYYAVMSVAEFARGIYGSTATDDRVTRSIIGRLGQISPLLMNQLNHDVLQKMGQGGADRCRTMMEQMRTLFRQRIKTLDWLSDATRQEALKKVETMEFYIGMPDNFSEGEFTLDEGNTLVEDALDIIAQNEAIKRRLCGKKVEEEPVAVIDYEIDYGMMNAFYHPGINSLIILPQFLCEDVFPSDDEYSQYAVATVFGHEMTHGFDSTGSKFDELGRLRDWWSPESAAKFKTKQQEMIALYNRLEAYPGQAANGEKTLGENMADYGGVTLAYTLFKQKKTGEGLQGAALDYALQEFFLHYVKLWQKVYDLEDLKYYYEIDSHSIFPNRVNGIVTLFDDWYRLFNVTGGELYLAPEQRVHIW